MSSLAGVRVLVLGGRMDRQPARADLDTLARYTVPHVLPVGGRSGLLTLLRVAKRILLNQDDLILLHSAPHSIAWPVSLLARLGGKPCISVSGRSGLSRFHADRERALVEVVARATGHGSVDVSRPPLRIDLGCGSEQRPGFVGIDARRTIATAIVGDARAVPVAAGVADQVFASCLLEHFDDPHQVLREIHRMLKPGGQAVLRLPNLGTYSSHLDTTHRFLADLALWRRILAGYFDEVRVVPVGTKYRDNPWLVRVNWVLVHLLKWYELAQGWDFVCNGPKPAPSVEYVGWWEE